MLQSRLHKCTKSASLTFCKNREITPSLYAEDDATRLICSPDVFKARYLFRDLSDKDKTRGKTSPAEQSSNSDQRALGPRRGMVDNTKPVRHGSMQWPAIDFENYTSI
jgi:hypothetical protein